MILALTLYACTVSEPLRQCRTVRLEAPGHSAAQQVMAEWIGEHEGFRVEWWSAGR